MSVNTRVDSISSDTCAAVDPSPISVATLSTRPQLSLPPLNLASVPRKNQADYDGVEVVRAHTTQAARGRRRSMSDLKAQRQRDYEMLVEELGIAPRPLKEEAGPARAGTGSTPRSLPPVTAPRAAAADDDEAPRQARTLTLPKPLVQRHSFYDKVSKRSRERNHTERGSTTNWILRLDALPQLSGIDKPAIMSDAAPVMSPTAQYVSSTREVSDEEWRGESATAPKRAVCSSYSPLLLKKILSGT